MIFSRKTQFFTILAALFCITACEPVFIPETSVPTGGSTAKVTAPTTVTASQGYKNRIQLSWDAVDNAKWYCIYYSPNQYTQFTKVAITDKVTAQKFQTSYELQVKSGSSAWYQITAVDSSGNESEVSDMVMGTSLACPLISSIEVTSDSTNTVNWFMNNVSEETYQNALKYVVTCSKNKDGSDPVEVQIFDDGSINSATFTGLSSHTTYYYSVEAYLKSAQDEWEKSDIVDAETAIKSTPNAPENLEVSKGTSTNEITLSWTLPDEIELASTTESSGFAYHNLYFKILRRPYSESSETAWTTIIDYYGFQDYEVTNPLVHKKITDVDEYQSGALITFTDTLSENITAQQYEYKVQSYADFAESDSSAKIITSNESHATGHGWTMPLPYFNVKNYLLKSETETDKNDSDEEVEVTYFTASVDFAITWDNLESTRDYIFIIKENHRLFDLDNGGTEDTAGTDTYISPSGNVYATPIVFDTTEKICDATKSFNMKHDVTGSTDNIRGYYTYTLYILNADEKDNPEISNAKTSVSSTELSVSNSDYKIENLIVEKGHKDKFVISFDGKTDYEYSISYTPIINGIAADEVAVTSFVADEDKNYVYEDAAESGDIRIYKVTGTDASGLPSSETTEKMETLGTPEPVFDSTKKSYKDITVSWSPVQMCSSYKIQLDSEDEIEITSENYNAEKSLYTYTFKDVDAYDETKAEVDALKAGANHSVKIITRSVENAENHIAADVTEAAVSCSTMGPANVIQTVTKGEHEDKILLTWNEVQGAASYTIQRIRSVWSVEKNNWEYTTPEFYIVTGKEEPAVSFNAEELKSASFKITYSEGVYTLIDINPYSVSETPDTSTQFGASQAYIGWGVPYTYTVIPLVNADDEYNYENGTGTINETQVTYKNISGVSNTGATVGYGINVTASKADFTDAITISWTKPSFIQSDAYPIIQGWVKGKESGSPSITKYPSNAADTSYKLNTLELTDVNIYTFKVQYRRSSNAISRSYAESYITALENNLDSNNEQLNEGYLFSIPELNFTNIKHEDGNEGYSEQVSWTLWNHAEKKCGPQSSYILYSRNYNNSNTWFPIAEISADGKVMTIKDSTATGGRDWYDCKFESSNENNVLTLTPLEKAASGTTAATALSDDSTVDHNGLLKVQRDYRHYYKLSVSRKNSDGDTIVINREATGYRRICGSEFIHNVLLIVADGLNQAGINTNADANKNDNNGLGYTTANGVTGTFMFKHHTNTKTLTYGTDGYNYRPYFYDLPGLRNSTFASSYTINFANLEERGSVDGNTLYHLPKTIITVTHESGMKSYSGTVTFTLGEQGTLSNPLSIPAPAFDEVKLSYSISASAVQDIDNKTSLEAKDATAGQTNQEAIFPYTIGSSHASGNNTYDSCSGSLASYKNLWWEVKE